MPTMAAISSVPDRRMILIIRSVPMLPEPMTATLVLVMSLVLAGSAGLVNDALTGPARRRPR